VDFRKRFPLGIGRPGVDEEVDNELEFHLLMRTRELMAQGMTEPQARRAALDRFGDLRRARRECRAIGHQREQRMRAFQYLSELWQDAGFAMRQMRAARGFTVVAVLTLAVGIGATTAIFSAMNAVVLRPLPIPQPERVVEVMEGWRDEPTHVSVSVFQDVAATHEAFETVAAINQVSVTLARRDGAERVICARVTGGFFDVFKMPPALGRVFGSDEDRPGREQVVVLSHRLWTRQFAADPSIVGRELTIDQRPYTVLGVMPASFDFSAQSAELWVPIAFTPAEIARHDEHYLTVYARLATGVTRQQAGQMMDAVSRRRVQVYPEESAERWVRVTPLMQQFAGEFGQRLIVLLGAVGFVLLIACGNVSNLLLARGASRARELALRTALGAGQGRLVRQLFTESIVLGLVSAAAGAALARWWLGLLIAFSPAGVPRLEQARIDSGALGFAVFLAIAASVLFGLVPAWRAAKVDVNRTLKESGRGGGAGSTRDIVRSTLIAGEVALALVLLVCAGLLIRSAVETGRVAAGFDPAGVFSGRVQLAEVKYGSPAALLRASTEIEDSVARIPNVQSAAIASVIPGLRSFSNGLLPEGKPLELRYVTQSDGVFVSPAYFRTIGLGILQGRGFDPAVDRAGSPLVVILNETAARLMWPGQDPIGKRLGSAHPDGLSTVIGIVADARLGGVAEPVPPTFYVTFAQLEERGWAWTRRSFFVLARTQEDAAPLAGAVRRVVASIDPSIPLYNVATLEQRMARTLEPARFNTVLLALLGGAGLLLAAVGIYGVIAYFATQRTSEIGIRMALGASRSDVVLLVVRQAIVPVLVGVCAGAGGARLASRAIATQLVNVRPTDPATFIAVVSILMIVGLCAALIPARRAASVDPTRALQG
jgi:putative ABC transport system permease protein